MIRLTRKLSGPAKPQATLTLPLALRVRSRLKVTLDDGASYHLGNRHVPLQIAPGRLRYQHDHVLDDMVRGMGLEVTVEEAPFEPEPGAYGGHHTSHGHGHRH